MAAIDSEKLYTLRKQIKKLASYKGSGTQLISVYIPAGSQVHEMSNKLREELSQASNIKSKSTKTNVMGALEKIIGHLKIFKKPPENGLSVFCGNISDNPAKIDIELFSLEPPQKLQVGIYRCDSRFFLEPLERMLEVRDAYGVVVLDGREATLAMVKGTEINIVKKMASLAHSKIKVGGQCLAAGTLIVREDGEIVNIEEIKSGEQTIGVDFNNSKTLPVYASDFFITPAKHSLIIKTHAPSCEIRATPYHRFFVLSEFGVKEKFAKNLDEKDRILIAKKINVVQKKKIGDWNEKLARQCGNAFGEGKRDIPKDLPKCDDRIVAAFLSGIYDAEGYLNGKNGIDIAMVDKELLKKVQLLLLRFGIVSSFAEKAVTGNRQWCIRITDKNALCQFKDKIGFSRSDKKEKLEKICTEPVRQQYSDQIPIDGREVFKLAQELGLKTSDFHAASCFFRNLKPLGREAFAKKILPVFEKHKNSKQGREIYYRLLEIHNSDVTVANIKEKTLVENKENFYDLTIPIHSNFVADGFIVHNSQARYQRLIEESIEKYYKRVGESMDKYFLNRVKGIMVGGPGPTKEFFLKAKAFNYQHKIIGPVDTGYTDEYGVREVLAKSEPLLQEQEAIKEKKLVDRFIKEVVSEGLATYGEKQVREAIMIKQAEKVLLSEGLTHLKATYVCTACGEKEEKVFREKPLQKIPCKCGSEMKLKEEEPLLDELADLAKANDIPVEIVSTNTTEGAQFNTGFGGIGAFLRYKRR